MRKGSRRRSARRAPPTGSRPFCGRSPRSRFIGITGHARPEILAHALGPYRFDTVLVALGMADRLVTSPETFLLPRAAERGVGVIAASGCTIPV